MTQVNECQGKGGGKGNRSLFFITALKWILGGKTASGPFSFLSLTASSGFDGQLPGVRRFPVVYTVPLPRSCPLRDGCNRPILEMRGGHWRSGRPTSTTSPDSHVTAGPEMNRQSYLAHVPSMTSSRLPGVIMGNQRPQRNIDASGDRRNAQGR